MEGRSCASAHLDLGRPSARTGPVDFTDVGKNNAEQASETLPAQRAH